MFGWEVPVFSSEAPVFDWEMPAFDRKAPVYGWEKPVFDGEAPVFDCDVPVFDWDAPEPCARNWGLNAREPSCLGRVRAGLLASHEASDLPGLRSRAAPGRATPPHKPGRATRWCPHGGVAPL